MSEKAESSERCFLCGCLLKQGNYTREHIPPKGIFATPLPENLITVPCCLRCNHGNHRVDELFRTILALSYNRSAAGEKIWNRVQERTIPNGRIKAELDAIVSTAKHITDPDGKPCVQFKMKQRPIKKQLIRLTMGLLVKFYPFIKGPLLEWEITEINQFKVSDALLRSGITSLLPYDFRGSGKEFQFWRGIATDKAGSGLWAYLFYDSVLFLVTHQPRTGINRRHAGIPFRNRKLSIR